MAEVDCEIEYLDEDEDIVQHCVETVDVTPAPQIRSNDLLVERRPRRKYRKRKQDEDDSDYEPAKYNHQPKYKKRKNQKVIGNTSLKAQKLEYFGRIVQSKSEVKEHVSRKVIRKPQYLENELLSRKQLDIRIPDYEDPLCMPVRAIKRNENDTKRLRAWNNLCLEKLESSDAALNPDNGEVTSSKRTIIIKFADKFTGMPETTVWSKTSVESKLGEIKSEVVQCVLPKFKETKVLKSYSLYESKRRRSIHHIDQVILTKEEQKDGETLIVYKPKETLSLVYRMFEEENMEMSKGANDQIEQKRYLKEVASCRVCAPCFQFSWRGFRKNNEKAKCQVCSKNCGSVYNLLSHLKSHSVADLSKYKRLISKALVGMADYHYKCRICQQQFPGIKKLRQHVQTHRGTATFICDIGNHIAT